MVASYGKCLILLPACMVVGEAHFISKPASGRDGSEAAEDDGVAMAPGVDEAGKAFLVLLDAGSWQELARAQLPYSTPYRFHGVWLPLQA